MSTEESLRDILAHGYDDNHSQLSEKKIEEFLRGIEKLDPEATKKKGYTLPLMDTIGRNSNESFSFPNRGTWLKRVKHY